MVERPPAPAAVAGQGSQGVAGVAGWVETGGSGGALDGLGDGAVGGSGVAEAPTSVDGENRGRSTMPAVSVQPRRGADGQVAGWEPEGTPILRSPPWGSVLDRRSVTTGASAVSVVLGDEFGAAEGGRDAEEEHGPVPDSP
jgi:hypothetical protein